MSNTKYKLELTEEQLILLSALLGGVPCDGLSELVSVPSYMRRHAHISEYYWDSQIVEQWDDYKKDSVLDSICDIVEITTRQFKPINKD